uniref:Laminin subunit alpha-1 n=1 Tax=Panagrellus redivivus TaxID=6233 RepID=A0A7E4ULG0_PANRE
MAIGAKAEQFRLNRSATIHLPGPTPRHESDITVAAISSNSFCRSRGTCTTNAKLGLWPNDPCVTHMRRSQWTANSGDLLLNCSADTQDDPSTMRQAKEKQTFIQGGQNCDFCQANSSYAHPASNMVDGTTQWWQSPPLSRGIKYNEVNITIDLEQEFHVASVWIQMANSPRPGTWILERSTDYGVTYTPWQYFAGSPAECSRRFGTASLRPIDKDDSVICTHEYSRIHPMEHGEILINLIENRPSHQNFSLSPVLQEFTRATNVRLRLLRTKTLQGHLMDLNEKDDPTVTRRYFYAIKEIYMHGRCICNGHADTCDILDVNRPRKLLCRCAHNTCGDSCDQCCPGFVQKKWKSARDEPNFQCERCNCHGHSEQCEYDADLDKNKQSIDIHGNLSGGGRCLNCRDFTAGVNCETCVDGYFRPAGVPRNQTDACRPCQCDPTKHNGKCAAETGKCECLPQFTGENCDQCAHGYYDPPECKPCQCHVNGTNGDVCLAAEDDQCPCKDNYGGKYCDECAAGFTNITAGCTGCICDETGASSKECNKTSGQCECKHNFGGLACDSCAKGFYNHPTCESCDCDPSGTEGDVCDTQSGQCLCKPGFAGKRCDQCDENYYGYPNCKPCDCDGSGSQSPTCDIKTGECPCFGNFTGRTCDKCAAGYYNYPSCLSCDCVQAGSKGLTCDSDGQCYCHDNFIGKHCDRCKHNHYNFPICEECNCDPNGVASSFAGCDKVAPGELCTCKDNVEGRTCNQCKPTFWDLRRHHPTGCIDCACNATGTVSLLNSCDQASGQCACKRFVAGQKCDQCADGFFQMNPHSHVGCEPCNCDVGGSLGQSCNVHTGQCRCRARVEGLKCDEPMKNHYFPSLWHMQYEAEDATLPNGKPVRYAIDQAAFPDFSYKGFAVFSPIQKEIHLDVDVRRSSMYKLLLHYINPTSVPIDLAVSVTPLGTATSDFQQNATGVLPVGEGAFTAQVSDEQKPFILNPGRWRIALSTDKRLFLDYIVLLPAEYYNAPLLSETVSQPCLAKQDPGELCIDLLYPPLPAATRVDATSPDNFKQVDIDGNESELPNVSVDDLPETIGQALQVESDNTSKIIRVNLTVPEDGNYHVVLEYYNLEQYNSPLRTQVFQGEEVVGTGNVVINHCPYATFCRELLSVGGVAASLPLKASPPEAVLEFTVQPNHRFGIVNLNLVKDDQWRDELLNQNEVCIRLDGVCEGLYYQPASNAIVTEAESGPNVNNSIQGDKLPFNIDDGQNVQIVSLDNVQSTVEVSGVVPQPGHYVFVVHYYNPDNNKVNVDVMVQNDRFADTSFRYCPSVTGCRTVVYDKQGTDNNQFYIEDKYTLTFYYNQNQKDPIYIDSVTAIPHHYYRENILKPKAIHKSTEFLDNCSENNFKNGNTSSLCKDKIFSLTTDFNGAALSCECNHLGSTDFCCEDFGGQCKCKPNIIGRKCDRCAAGFYDFPNCLKCKCGLNQQCDERTGQCFCPHYVEGQTCDKCVSNAFGYDPLIGCQLCGCHPDGSENGILRCDADSGQCLCKDNVGGRQCDRCLPGYHSFPHCYPCQCNTEGTTEAICDPDTAQCLCKKNVQGQRCEQCVGGTFFLSANDIDGCSDCYCFGVTDRCTSSNLPVDIITFDDQSWTTDDVDANITGFRGVVTYNANPESPKKNVYFIRKFKDVDHTASYGLSLSFIVASFKGANDTGRSNNNADVILNTKDEKLEFWSYVQPANAEERFSVKVPLLPNGWSTPSGEPVSRSQFMNVLRNLESIGIKASYYDEPSKAILEQFEIEVAGNMSYQNPIIAKSVEHCYCPAPYTGSSCQYCSKGYYRVKSDGVQGSACVPCNCHSHSGECDADTGVCLDCGNNTEGEHCERCLPGYYGNATNGSPYACQACPCPYATAANNFALSCVVSEYGSIEKCNCRPGFTGERCETCDIGFYGNPSEWGGSCDPCYCNDNNNLTEYGSCHPVSGDCAQCNGNTDGRHCEICKQWYYGDAIDAKNCTECSCNQCGSNQCDNFSGTCECQPNVEGENCDKCVENAWGFDSCQGCRMCNCAAAASNTQCDAKTGQCACMPGTDGQYCQHCKHGFWNYGPEGCKKCDCEADLSMGTVCDINTGQCHCQEGASGPRCDTCIAGFLRIPTLGCRQCDECVFALDAEIDGLNIAADALSSTLANVSSVALTGSRLHKINKVVEQFKPRIELIQSVNSEDSVLKNLSSLAEVAFNEASSIELSAARLNEQIDALQQRLNEANEETNNLRSDTRDLFGVAQSVVDSINRMASEFETRPPITNKEALITEAEDIVEKLRQSGLEEELKILEKNLNDTEKLQEKIQDRNFDVAEQDAHLANLTARLDGLRNLTHQFTTELKGVNTTAQEASEKVDKLPFFELKSLVSGIEKDVYALEEVIAGHEDQAKNIVDVVAQIRDLQESINTELPNLVKATEEAKTLVSTQIRLRRAVFELNETDVTAKLAEIERKAQALQGIYDAARLEAYSMVDASHIYEDLVVALNAARNSSAEAIATAHSANSDALGITDSVNEVSATSNALKSNASELENSVKESVDQRANLEERLKALDPTIQQVQELVKSHEKELEEVKRIRTEQERVEKILNLIDQVNSTVDDLTPKIAEIKDRLNNILETENEIVQARDNSKAQLEEANRDIPVFREKLVALEKRLDKNENTAGDYLSRIAALKEKIALARDKTNMIKLSAHFEPSSHLELPLPNTANDVSAYTEIRFFFRTPRDTGSVLYLGNEERKNSSEYIAFVVDEGKPKLIMNLGDGESAGVLDVTVNDNQWREVIIRRAARNAVVEISKPQSDETASQNEVEVAGPKSVLNLDDESHRILLGGFPENFNIPSVLPTNSFNGDIDNLRVNGMLIGLWNGKKTGNVLGAPHRPLVAYEASEEKAVSFNGHGYLQLDVSSSWNLRKRTVIMLSFMSYSPDGLLFFVGKDHDHLVVELSGGFVSLSFDLGSGVRRIKSNNGTYNNGKMHTIQINRNERHAKLIVDSNDIVEGESPGTMFEMSISDSIYLGGLPQEVNARFTVQPLRGCLKNLKIDSDYANLGQYSAAKGIQPSCPYTLVRTASLISERAQLTVPKLAAKDKFDLSLRFRTQQTPAHIVSVLSAENEDLLHAFFENGEVVVGINGDDEELRLKYPSAEEGNWHSLHLSRTGTELEATLDDITNKSINVGGFTPSDNLRVQLGKQEDRHFVGCLADLVWNGHIVNFADSVSNEVKLTECTVNALAPSNMTSSEETEIANDENVIVNPMDLPTEAPVTAETTTTTPETTTRKVGQTRPEGSCALLTVPYGEREDSVGYRFGTERGSRLEYDKTPSALDRNAIFSIQLRALSTNGFIFFISNEKQTEFITLYLNNGFVHFLFGQPNNNVHLISTTNVLDTEWHTVRVEREGSSASLFVDDVHEANNGSAGLEDFEVQPPLYVGGLSKESVPIRSKIFNARKEVPIRSEFSGCLRDFKINGRKLDNPSLETGVVPCSTVTESGVYFGSNGGYAVLDNEFASSQDFAFELEVRPRTKNGVLLSVGVLEYATLQLVNGSVVFSVNIGNGNYNVSSNQNLENAICDGHWHHIKVTLKKTIITISIDQRSAMTFIKRGIDVISKDPLYLGGMPKDKKLPGIIATDPYVGCIRNVILKKSKDSPIAYELGSLPVYGDVSKTSCPLN